MKTPMYLYILSFLSSLIIYIFYIRYRLHQFHPQVDVSAFISLYTYHYHPEIEAQLYILGWLFVIACGLLIFFVLRRLIQTSSVSKRLFFYGTVLFDLLCIGFVYWLVFSLVSQIMELINSTNTNLVRLFQAYSYTYFTGFSWWQFLSVLFLLVISFFLWFKQMKLLPAAFKIPVKFFADILAILVIFYFVSIIVNWRNGWNNGAAPYFDYQAVVGPINDVLGGKTLLVNIHSQYGLLMIYVLTILFKIIPLSYNIFFWVNYATTILGYSMLYSIMRKWLKSVFLAYLGIFLISQHHYFSQNINILFYGQLTFLRFGMWIPLLLYLLLKNRLKFYPKTQLLIELFLVGVASFWGFDVGVHVLGAYLAYSTVNVFVRQRTTRQVIRNLCFYYFRVIGILLTFFVIISLYTFFRSGVWPDWTYYTGAAVQFGSGWGMLPMPLVGPYFLFIALYLGCCMYIFYSVFLYPRKMSSEKQRDMPIVSFVTAYGILQFLYYVGRSTENNLHVVTLPFILLTLWVLSQLKQFIMDHGIRIPTLRHTILCFGCVMVLILSFSTLTTVGIIHAYHYYLRRGVLTSQTDELPNSEDKIVAIDAIQDQLKNANRREIALISGEDTFFLMKTKSVNIIDSNNIYYFWLNSQFDQLGNQLLQRNPPVVFMDHTIDDFWNLQIVLLKKYVTERYRLKGSAGYLDIWERN